MDTYIYIGETILDSETGIRAMTILLCPDFPRFRRRLGLGDIGAQ